MKIIAVLDADLAETPLGTRSRLAEVLAGEPVLRRTVGRLSACERLDGIIVTCPKFQLQRVQNLLEGTPVTVRGRAEGQPPYRPLVRTARKWSLDAWRGGLGGSSAFDEYTDTIVLAALGRQLEADAVAAVPPGAALLDPKMTDAMIQHFVDHAEEMRMTFAQAPPGLTPTIFQTHVLQQLADNHVPPGWTLSYKPDDPSMDLALKACCFASPEAVRCASGRLCADTARSMRTMQDLVDEGVTEDAGSIGRWLIRRQTQPTEPLPREVEIELTTADTLADTVLRPRGARLPDRGPLDLELVEKLAGELAAEDDSLVVLGGHGDPLLCPHFAEALGLLRRGSVYGLTVCTTGQQLPDQALAALLEHRVDVVAFLVDAWTPETYARLSGGADLANVKASIARLAEARQSAAQVQPIIVPQFTKCTENVQELDDFFDGWLRQNGCVSVIGSSHFGKRLPDLAVTDMSPPTRTSCRRLVSRCMVLADGTVVPCDQDFAGDRPLGHLGCQTLREIWSGDQAAGLRANHLDARYEAEPLCAPCTEWHRP